MISKYYSLFLYFCVDLCYDIQGVPYKSSVKTESVLLGNLKGNFENITSNFCSFCDDKFLDSSIGDASSYTKFYYFSRETGENYTEIEFGNTTSLFKSGFNISKPTKILAHGWMDSGLLHFSAVVKDAYLQAYDANVIAIDWSKMAYQFYPISRVAVDPVGRYLAQFVDWLVTDVGVPPSSLHLVGHSLGAHIAGVAGEHVTSGLLYRISGCDPAGPGFDWQKNGRLDASDASFVDIVHTSGGWAGYFDPCGHVDFYPNGGTPIQPGCPISLGKCSHARSYWLFAESIVSNGFKSRSCDGWNDFKKGDCDNNTVAYMGEYVDRSATGKFYLKTAGQSPYALG
ncbi:lipoprotein lipase-like [Macrosteles quadrilineatus]|uniref:lipoprotein lipase-like n=1 Tax=Macrosteles quadrilineatus TaxID=74068 RepID=UPI0023E1864D|nr:lipoprotein lipase-like [Macrosteles quadrilineatus]